MNAYCRLTGKCSYANLRTQNGFHTESGRFDFTKALLFVEFTTSLGSRPSDAPHAGPVRPYNSEPGGSGYEVLKYFMMAKQYNIRLLQIHLTSG
jgi:hypothetical protein